LQNRIYHVIDESEIELTPMEIARKLFAPRKPTVAQCSSVRTYCTRLRDRGLILQPYPGSYCNKVTYGVRFVPLCVHNIRLHANVCVDLKSEVVEEVVGGVKIRVCFGSERRKVSGWISCDVSGMSHDACLLALNRWFEVAESKLGFELVDVALTTFELNKDYVGVRLDGLSCVTKRGLFGLIERTYQKEESIVRREVKVSEPMSLNRFDEVAKKGFVGLEGLQSFEGLRRSVQACADALKFTNGRLLEVERLVAGLAKAQIVQGESLGRVLSFLESLGNGVSKNGDDGVKVDDVEGSDRTDCVDWWRYVV
jgi:hypothetical protein